MELCRHTGTTIHTGVDLTGTSTLCDPLASSGLLNDVDTPLIPLEGQGESEKVVSIVCASKVYTAT